MIPRSQVDMKVDMKDVVIWDLLIWDTEAGRSLEVPGPREIPSQTKGGRTHAQGCLLSPTQCHAYVPLLYEHTHTHTAISSFLDILFIVDCPSPPMLRNLIPTLSDGPLDWPLWLARRQRCQSHVSDLGSPSLSVSQPFR